MATRAPQVSAEDTREKPQPISNDDPVLLAFQNAPLDDEPMTEAEILALEEWRAAPEGTDSATVSSMIAERARREK